VGRHGDIGSGRLCQRRGRADLAGGARLAAIVTQESTEWLALRTQQTAIALVKASAVLLAVDAEGARLSARNRLDGTVRTLVQGSVNAEVTVDSTAGVPVVAIVPRSTSDELRLAPGAPVTAFVKASDILLAVVD
jgi:molybdate transport system regulatory protein